MRLSELAVSLGLVTFLTVSAIGGTVMVVKGLPYVLNIEDAPPQDRRPQAKREPISQGNDHHDGMGRPWTHDDQGKPLPGYEGCPAGESNVAYHGWPYGK